MVGGRRRTRDMKGRPRGKQGHPAISLWGAAAGTSRLGSTPVIKGAPREHDRRCTARRAGQAGTGIIDQIVPSC
jgi:hypothetical protein